MPDSLFDALRSQIAQAFGIQLDDDQVRGLYRVLREHLKGSARDPLAAMRHALDLGELERLIPELTVGESYFLRDPAQLDAIIDVAVRERMRARAGSRSLRVVSAGSAAGEELYSLAILIRDRLPALLEWSLRLEGVDLNPQFVSRAREGLYTAWALRRTPEDIRDRWFEERGTSWQLRPPICRMATFQQKNLMEEDAAFWAEGSIDVLLCRNVLIYFTPDAAAQIMDRFERALAPGGYLFLGPADTSARGRPGLELREAGGAFFFQKITPILKASSRRRPVRGPVRLERIQAQLPLAEENEPPQLAELLRLFREERFHEVLQRAHEQEGRAGEWPFGLVRAAAFSALGRHEEAQAESERLIAEDALNAEAHHLLALCSIQRGAVDEARRCAEAAVYLDPSFALPELQLGLLARRRGDPRRARKELTRAAELLEREQEERIVLFGGGFSRGALVDLCRGALAALDEKGAGVGR